MDFLTVARLARRWWFLVLPMLLVSCGLALLVAQSVPVNYQAGGTLIFQPPVPVANAANTVPTTVPNKFAGAGSPEVLAASIMATVMNDPTMKDALKKAGAGDFKVTQLKTDNGENQPLLAVESSGTSPTEALKTVQLVSDAMSQQLQAQQQASGVDPSALITVRPLLSDPSASRAGGGRIRALIAVAAIGIAATFSLPFLLEGLSRSRRREASEWTERLYEEPDLDLPPTLREPAKIRD